MAISDETTIYCNRCQSYNIGEECCLCKSCVESLIDAWVGGCDKLFETEDINRLKKLFAIEVDSE